MSVSKSTLRLAVVLVCAASAGPSAQPAATNTALPERVPFLKIVATPGFQVPSFQNGPSGEFPLMKDEPFFPVGIETDVHGACSSNLSMPAGKDVKSPNASVVWWVDASLISVDGDAATVDLRWRRHVPRAGVLVEGDLERTDRLVLRDGARGGIDVVHAAEGVTTACSHFTLGLEVQFRAPGNEVADAGFGYDLWLVDRAARAPAHAVKARAMGRQGRNADYAFAPVALPGGKGAITVHVAGAINGQARADGSIELNVDHWQGVHTESSASGSGGRKRLTVRDGETVELELPAELKAKLPADLRDHDFALRVTTERLW
jgi:hypothetical protein